MIGLGTSRHRSSFGLRVGMRRAPDGRRNGDRLRAHRYPGSEPGPRKALPCGRHVVEDSDRQNGSSMALYDQIAELYDPWSRSVTEDIEFYVEEAVRSGGPIVELAVGTGRIAVPIAAAGIPVIGVDQSAGMLSVARRYAEEQSVEKLLDLRVGDLRQPPVDERVPLVICPFRSLLHMPTSEEKLAALQAARSLLVPGGRLVFDVFSPTSDDIEETHGRWLEREPGIFERADWDEASRTMTLSVKRDDTAATFTLHWLSATEWRDLIEAAGFDVEALYGWFDRRPFEEHADTIWICRPRD
jgi:ubiquinone/menaquinone biosynthesis C-methylase UbiE